MWFSEKSPSSLSNLSQLFVIRPDKKNKRSFKAKIQLGLGLFCCKKPLKLKYTHNLLTHPQREFKRNRPVKRCSELEDQRCYNLFISRDDKS